MKASVRAEIEVLRGMTVSDLREKYIEVFGEECRSRHKDFLRKRIAWRIQANEYGGLSERALRRAAELANEADLRMLAPKGGKGLAAAPGRTVIGRITSTHDRRLPMPGTLLTRQYRGRTITVTVLPDGFEYEGQIYRSLSAIAKVVTGSHWNGLLFFGLARKP